MVCNRCILVVQNELDKLGIEATNIKLGEITLKKDLTTKEREELENVLDPLGFQVIDDKKSRMIEKIKNVIIDLVHHQDNDAKTNLSDVLSDALHHDYNYLSNLFSDIEGTTIEKYFIAQKVEKIKELINLGTNSSEVVLLATTSLVFLIKDISKKLYNEFLKNELNYEI